MDALTRLAQRAKGLEPEKVKESGRVYTLANSQSVGGESQVPRYATDSYSQVSFYDTNQDYGGGSFSQLPPWDDVYQESHWDISQVNWQEDSLYVSGILDDFPTRDLAAH